MKCRHAVLRRACNNSAHHAASARRPAS